MSKTVLVEKVIQQIKKDIWDEELEPLESLLKVIPEEALKAYLPEDKHE